MSAHGLTGRGVAVTVLLVLLHAGLVVPWLGGMVYSLVVVQPRAERFLDDDAYEAFAATLADGNRRSVLALATGVALSGLALGWATGWRDLPLHAAKGLLFVVALGCFAYVSWWHWPRRAFAVAAERPALRRQLRLLAYAITGCVGVAAMLGVVAAHA